MAESPRPLVIPFFVSHQGCPHRCIFCDQNSITGSHGLPQPDEIVQTVNRWLAERRRGRGRVEVAFYGGSFTAIGHDHQTRLLEAVRPFLVDGRVDSVRISTRPDYLDQERLGFLRRAGVRTVEVGVQSLRDDTLAVCGRGHDSATAIAAVKRLRQHGFVTGVQLMLGLPGETTASTINGARLIAGLRPDIARIYPTLVISGTALARLWRAGRYHPLSIERAVLLAARVREILEGSGTRVIRCGLQAETGLGEKLIAGPCHPAFGELVYSRMIFRRARQVLRDCPAGGRLMLSHRDESAFRGHGGGNFKKLTALGAGRGICFSDLISRGCVEFSRQGE